MRWLRLVLWGAGAVSAAGIVGFAAGAAITDRLERDNRFCIACHRPEKPLHAEVYRTFAPVDDHLVTLAGAHNMRGQGKCIDCHIGATRKDYAVIKTIAAWDTARWIAGAYQDPETLRYPLGDRTCLKCHPDGGQNPRNLKASHREAPAEARFLQAAIVKPRCDACHQAILGIPGR